MGGQRPQGLVEEWMERLRYPRSKRDLVYLLLSALPPGYTVTYGVLAALAGTSPRAVGRWMAKNRVLVVVPCHRVVASRGLGGFSRGLGFKRRLLELEGALRGKSLRVIRSVSEYWAVLGREGVDVASIEDP